MTEQIVSSSPQDPSDVVVSVPATEPAGVAATVARARADARCWAGLPAPQRALTLNAMADAVAGAADELTSLMVREVGKPVTEAAGETARAIAILRYYAQQVLDPVGETYPAPDGRSLLFTRRRPHGVAGLITPWNFPLAIPIWKAAPALAFGNAVVLKPAPESTGLAMRLLELFQPLLPCPVFHVVAGDAETGAAVVDTADVVSFTGSAAAGAAVRVAAARAGVPVQCEMGSVNSSIVLPDYDVEAAAAAIAGAAMGYAGQKCTATSRIVAVGDPAPLTEAFVAAVEALKSGDPADQSTVVGPVIGQEPAEAVVAAAGEARRSGGRVLTGGYRLDRDGWFVAPTVATGVRSDHRIAQEEIFGPFCVVLSAADVAQAVARANDVRYGLVSAIFTNDLTEALGAAAELDTGLVRINAPTSGVDFYAPFGGEKASGSGPREQGKAARDFYTSIRTVTMSARS